MFCIGTNLIKTLFCIKYNIKRIVEIIVLLRKKNPTKLN